MKQIKIGTCVPGPQAETWIEQLKDKGFESFSINYHMSLEGADLDRLAVRTADMLKNSGAQISTIGFYCNPLQNPEHREALKLVIKKAEQFGASHVSTFAGALEGKPVEESFREFGMVFRELAQLAEEKGIRLGIENCPMGGTWERASCNIGFHPKAWEAMFEEVKNENFGLEWEPAHAMMQLMEPVSQLKQWSKKIVHVHGKDASIDWESVKRNGVFGAVPYAVYRMPGFGNTDWREIISILRMSGYEDDICIEGYHDPVYCGEWEMTGQLHALSYLKWCRGGEFVPSPWCQ